MIGVCDYKTVKEHLSGCAYMGTALILHTKYTKEKSVVQEYLVLPYKVPGGGCPQLHFWSETTTTTK